VSQFPSVKWPALRRVLEGGALSYHVERTSGSHRTMKSADRPTLHLSFHDDATLPPGLVRKILVKDVGLTEEEALKLVS
jgi:predicted RNA binding protein YcfA (HicA-like mRNA interferase family)